jgi:DNA-binding response OmpR family regulator
MNAKILYAEDEEQTRSLVADELRQEGYIVDTANDGEAAIELLAARAYDLVLLDIRMPRKNGLDVLSFLQQQNRHPRVIMLTAVDELTSAIQAVKLGANDYLTKPFRLEQLLAAIERILHR